MAWPCFWTERTDRAVFYLRRFTFSKDTEKPCPESGYYGHSAERRYGVRKLRLTAEGFIEFVKPGPYKRRKEWPKSCRCGYRFKAKDEWQVRQEPIYRRPDTGEEWEQRKLPPGAMFDGTWSPDDWKGDDGLAVHVVLPDAEGNPDHPWNVDGPASSGGHWTRTGDPRAVPPTIDVNPSILTSKYHGFLRHGVLTDPV